MMRKQIRNTCNKLPCQGKYRDNVSHLLVDMGWVDFDYGAAQLLLPNSHQPRQNWADSGTLKIQVNPTQSTSTCDMTPYRKEAKTGHVQ